VAKADYLRLLANVDDVICGDCYSINRGEVQRREKQVWRKSCDTDVRGERQTIEQDDDALWEGVKGRLTGTVYKHLALVFVPQ
jgi:hypothetical protein